MGGVPHDAHDESARVSADLATIEARLRQAQVALDRAAAERRVALARLDELQEQRVAQQAKVDAAARSRGL